MGMLWERADKNSELEPEMSCRVVIGCVKNLIEVEQDYLSTKASYRLVVYDTATIFAPLLTWKSLKNVDIAVHLTSWNQLLLSQSSATREILLHSL